MQVHWTLEG
uniref:Uncharacterized protein n=1 Tax=Anguilla anguilla TaxID=7936 RepID=A0A0E9Q672_ANGAN